VSAATVIGLTGDVGSGKTAVRRWLEDRGAAALDADEVVHRLLDGDAALRRAVAARFGGAVLADGRVDRAALARQVFGDPAALADLEAILHPPVLAAVADWLARVTRAVAVVEAVKLVEAGLDAAVGQVWLVVCARGVRRLRLVARGWSAAEAERRMAAGTALAPRLARADVVVDNGGPWPATEAQLSVAWRRLRAPGGA
jgi:dephospho-CoA kinase